MDPAALRTPRVRSMRLDEHAVMKKPRIEKIIRGMMDNLEATARITRIETGLCKDKVSIIHLRRRRTSRSDVKSEELEMMRPGQHLRAAEKKKRFWWCSGCSVDMVVVQKWKFKTTVVKMWF